MKIIKSFLPGSKSSKVVKKMLKTDFQTNSMIPNDQEGLCANQGASKDGWSFEVRKKLKISRRKTGAIFHWIEFECLRWTRRT